MPDPTSTGERFELKPVAPVRALAISSAGAVVGAGLIVLAASQHWPLAIMILGVVLLTFAMSLALTALLLVRRMRMVVVAGADDLAVQRGRRSRSVPWSMIDNVSLRGPRLTVVTKSGGGADLVVTNPRTQPNPTFQALIAALRRRLDVDRGYRPAE